MITVKEIPFESIDYSKPEVIQALLRFYYDFKEQGHSDMNEDLIITFVDIDTAMKKVDLTERQLEAINHYKMGWTEEEIGVMMGGISHQAVHKLIMKVCNKISNYLSEK